MLFFAWHTFFHVKTMGSQTETLSIVRLEAECAREAKGEAKSKARSWYSESFARSDLHCYLFNW